MKFYKNLLIVFLVIQQLNVVSQNNYFERGIASFYADKFEGRITASGEIYKHSKLTAAHPELPFGTFVKITNLTNGNSVIVVINDRGPYVGDRIIDLSKKAAIKLDFIALGTTEVSLEVVEKGNGEEKALTDTVKTKEPSAHEYYKLRSTKYQPNGYGIQIASYAEIANLMRVSENVNNSIKKELTIQVVNHQNSKAYRLIVGNFKTKQEAEKYKQTLQKQYPDCFVISYKK